MKQIFLKDEKGYTVGENGVVGINVTQFGVIIMVKTDDGVDRQLIHPWDTVQVVLLDQDENVEADQASETPSH